jgi:hypothetical protein
MAARVAANARTHASRVVFAHTGPAYLKLERRANLSGAAVLVDELADSIHFIRKNYEFASQADLAIAVGRFEQARQHYAKLAATCSGEDCMKRTLS